MILQLANAGQLNATFQTKTVGGITYQIYPVVMLVEGVHHGLGTDPVYYPPQVIEASAPHWNNMPITINHPVDASGTHVMCNTDGTIRTAWEIGLLKNVKWDGKLKGELWVNVASANQKEPALLPFLANGGQLEVSTGLLAADDGAPGTWNGEAFNASIQEIIPDHIALLPGSTGACSWNDGCGVRFNKEVTKEGNTAEIINAMEEKDMAKTATPADKAICAEKAVTPADKAKCKEMTVNAMIENQDNAFVEADRVWLNSLDEVQFSKIIANAEPKEVIKEVEKIVEKVIDNTKEAPTTLEGWLGTVPGEIRSVVNAGLKELDNKRAGFIAKIMTAETNKFTEPQLKSMDINVLESIVSLMPVPKATGPSYMGAGGGNIITNEEHTEEVYVPQTLSDVLGKKVQ